METKTNTGLGLMIATMQRVENQKSLFKSALKKLVNSSEIELRKFLGNNLVVTSDGRNADQLIHDLRENGNIVSDYAKDIMSKKAFVITSRKTYNLVIIKGEEFSDSERITKNIRAEAKRRGYLTPPAEVAPLLRELLSDEEIEAIGLYWLAVMHEPIKDSDSDPSLLVLDRDDVDCRLNAYYDYPDNRWYRERGFVFLLSQD